MAAGITSFLSQVSRQGGFSFSNNFLVEFKGSKGGVSPANFFNPDLLEIFCEEAQLPNSNTATGTQVGLITGLGSVDYPHTRVFTEFSLTFMLDANLNILKALNAWYYVIIGGMDNNNIREKGNVLSPNRVMRVGYKDDYLCDIYITKTEAGKDSSTERKPITYVMEKAWPYQIDAIPLQFGSSQITKVTAQFKYERHYTIMRDVRKAPQITKGDGLGPYQSVTPLTDQQKQDKLNALTSPPIKWPTTNRQAAAAPPPQ